MSTHAGIDYLELPASDLAIVETFYGEVFGWQFESYGPDYLAFEEARLSGGFYRANLTSVAANGATLIVFYAEDLEAVQEKVTTAGGTISQPIFDFPGGRRFHFLDPCGNELAVWTKTQAT